LAQKLFKRRTNLLRVALPPLATVCEAYIS
jgi:hypothetical protein